VNGPEDGENILNVWDLQTSTVIASMNTGHRLPSERTRVNRGGCKPVFCCAIFADEQRALTGGWDGKVKVWDLENSTEIATLTQNTLHKSTVLCCAAEGRRAVSGAESGAITVWDLERNIRTATLYGHHLPSSGDRSGSVTCISVFAGGKQALSGNARNATVSMWDLESGTEIAVLTGHSNSMLSSPNAFPYGIQTPNCVSCCAVFSACNGVFKKLNEGLVYTFLACGNRQQISSSEERKDALGTQLHSVCRLSRAIRLIFSFARETDSDGLRAVTGAKDGTLKVWDLGNRTCLKTLDAGFVPLCCDVFADGTNRILASGRTNRIDGVSAPSSGVCSLKIWS
jgi:WD40 repeat protein